MGWLEDWWNKDDPRSAIEVDRSLEDFLRKQKPQDYKPASEQPSTSPERQTYREQLGFNPVPTAPKLSKQQDQAETDKLIQEPSEKPLPAESLFQDGRYKELWATYRPQKEVEEATKTDQERLSDIARGWRMRTAETGRAAMENCANESIAVHDCFRNGSWKSRMTMCRDENRALSRCMLMQKRFLNALGYMSIWDRSSEESDRIQMHADALYQQMLEQEKLIKQAKEKGLPVPEFTPLVNEADKAQSQGYKIKWEDLPEETKQQILENRLKDLDGPALELGKKAVEADISRKADAIWQIDDHYWMNRKHREERYLEGTETWGDMLRRWHETKYRNRPFPEKPDEVQQQPSKKE